MVIVLTDFEMSYSGKTGSEKKLSGYVKVVIKNHHIGTLTHSSCIFKEALS